MDSKGAEVVNIFFVDNTGDVDENPYENRLDMDSDGNFIHNYLFVMYLS
jgi:hypothetical protein